MTKVAKILSVALFTLCFSKASRAQTTQGTDFWLTSLLNYTNTDSFFVIISSEKATSVKVEIPLQSWSQTLSLGYNDLQRVFIPNNKKPTKYDSIQNFGIHVTSTLPISVYALSAQSATTDASCIFPTDVLPKGGTYYSSNPIVYGTGYNSGNSMSIVCIDDTCTVEIIPKYATRVKGYAANTVFKVKLLQGQVFMTGAASGGKRFAGTLVKAQAGKRVAVFSGDECVAIRCAACDHVYEEIPPTTTLGKKFIISPFIWQQKGYDYQIIGTESGTTVKENNVTVATLNASDTVYRIVKADSIVCIESDKPILLVQYMTGLSCQSPKGGDPSMLVVNPNEQTITKAKVSTANTSLVKTHYINIIVPKQGIDSTYLDGYLIPKINFKKSPCGDYYVYRDSVSAGNHGIECSKGFICYIYGIGTYESYAYSAGSGMKNLKRYIIAQSYPSCDSGFIVKLSSVGDSATRFKWLFNNSQKDTVKNPYFIVSKPGVYPVKLNYMPYGKTYWDSTTSDVLVEKPSITDFIPFNVLTVCDSSYTIKLPVTSIFSYKWNTGDTTPNLKVTASGLYKVKIHNNKTGCNTSDSAYIKLRNKIRVDFAYKMFMFCPGIPLYLYDSTKLVKDTVATYKWYADKVLRSTQKNDTIKSPRANEYEIKHVVTTTQGCRDSMTKLILISDVPTAVTGISKYDTCVKSNYFRFNNGSYNSLGKIVRYKWLFSNGDTTSTQSVFKNFKGTGVFSYRLIAYSEKGCFDTSDAKYFKVYPGPKPAFSVLDSSVCLKGNYFYFKNNTAPDTFAKTYVWMWGDGSGTTFDEPGSIPYSDTGKYLVSLVARYSKTGCTDTVSRYVRVNPSPVAKMTVDSSNFCLNKNYYAFRNTSDAKGATSKSITWKWGDGTQTIDTFNYRKKYPSVGTYKVKMYFSTGKGCLDSTQKNVIIYSSPTAKFSISDSNTCGTNNYFNIANQSTAPANAKWDWQYGDGNSSTVKNPGKISYSIFGSYKIRMVVRDPLTTCTDTAYHKVTVSKSPNLKPRVSDTVVCTNKDSFVFYDSTDYGNMKPQRLWKFNGSNTDTIGAIKVKKGFAGKGIQTITLVGGVPGFCADTTNLTVRIKYSNTVASISHKILYPCVDGTANLIATPTEGNGWNYNWNTGNGKTFTTQNPSGVIYTDTFLHYITLSMDDGKGCKFTYKDSVKMLPAPNVSIANQDGDTQCLKGNIYHFNSTVNNAKTPVTFAWSLDENNSSSLANPAPVSYAIVGKKDIKLVITDANKCKDSTAYFVVLETAPSVSINDDSACDGTVRNISAQLTPPNFPVKSIDWYLNNLYIQTGNTYSYTFDPVGKNKIKVIVTTTGKCKDTSNEATMTTWPIPTANFGVDMQKASGTGVPVNFIDSSTGATVWNWYPEPNVKLSGKNGSYLYGHVGDATAKLVVMNNYGCIDSTSKTFTLKSEELGWFPTSFTPDGNGRNDVFKPIGLSAVKLYTLSIYDRWGEKLFETTDPNQGWDGTYMGQRLPEGNFVYSVTLIYFTGKRQSIQGIVTLLK